MKYLLILSAIAALYGANRFLLIPASSGTLRLLASCYFADFLAGGVMVCVLNGALEASGRRPVGKLLPISAYLLACGTFWELVTPLYLPRSVGDPWDILAVLLGGAGLLLLLRKTK